MFLNLNLLLPTLPAFTCWVQNTKIYKRTFKFVVSILALLTQLIPASAQNVTNGTFDNRAANWGCSPEATHKESTYGGSSTSNRVAEVDKQAGLCQTISGFTVGYEYALSFKCSRRTTCGPTLQTMDVTVSGGVLTQTVSRNGGGFNFTTESFNFVADATSHTITFVGTVSGTCGLIVDDIEIELINALPVELVDFSATKYNDNSVQLAWETAMELNNDYFTIERSTDAVNWNAIGQVFGAGNSDNNIGYEYLDNNPLQETAYYRLKQTDFDGTFAYSPLVVVKNQKEEQKKVMVYPNPSSSVVTVTNIENPASLKVFNSTGQDVSHLINLGMITGVNEMLIDISNLRRGLYHVMVNGKTTTLNKI